MDPRLARMIVEGGRRNVAREVMIIAAALSIQDPRERPAEERDKADLSHSRFADPTSDLLTYLNLWQYLKDQQRDLSGSAFRRQVRSEYLNYLRIREWQDVVTQLRELAKPLGIVMNAPRNETAAEDDPLKLTWDGDRIHVAILAGLLSQIGMQEATEVAAPAAGKATAEQAPAQRVPRRPRRAVRDLPGLGPGAEAPGVGHGRRARRDQSPVGPRRRAHPARVGRGGRRAPGQAHVLRAGVVDQAGRGDGVRAGAALRRPDRHQPPRALRQGRPRARPRAVRPARPRAGRVDHAPPVLPREPAPARRGGGPGGPGPTTRPGGRRRHAVRVLRRAGPGRRRLRPALRPVVEDAPVATTPTCCRSRASCWSATAGRDRRVRRSRPAGRRATCACR